MLTNRKALFFDIDGTLLSEITGEIPASAVRALREASEKGHLTFINTGRTVCSIPTELKQLPIAGFACGCGTYISYGNEVLLARSIPHERGREIIKVITESGGAPILEGQEDCYFPERMTRFEGVESTRRYFKQMGIGIETYLEKDNFDYDKLVFYTDAKTDKERIIANLERDMVLMGRGSGFYEAAPKAYSKATAIEFVLQHFGIALDNAYVFGDSSNDLSMFQYVPHAIAMERHDRILDPYTEYLTKAVEQDGIAVAMRHYNIIMNRGFLGAGERDPFYTYI